MVEIRTPPKRVRLRSAYDPRWLIAFGFGLIVSLAYYGLLIWAAVWLIRCVVRAVLGS